MEIEVENGENVYKLNIQRIKGLELMELKQKNLDRFGKLNEATFVRGLLEKCIINSPIALDEWYPIPLKQITDSIYEYNIPSKKKENQSNSQSDLEEKQEV